MSPRGKLHRWRMDVRGRVQGVGFRPFVYRIAQRHGIAGSVMNTPFGVRIDAEATKSRLSAFKRALLKETPPLAHIDDVKVKELKPKGGNGFTVRKSSAGSRKEVVVPPDVATCRNCLTELMDRKDRRYHYPFINCTDCGPRYTITLDVPYDRARTTMSGFKMCKDCQREYDEPSDRRFHAQPNACPVCGPEVYLLDNNGRRIRCKEPIKRTVRLLKEGKIVAIRGLGGYHLACDATNAEAVRELRRRKHRPFKPFAVMVAELADVERIVEPTEKEKEALSDWRAPIVLCKKRAESPLAEEVAPNLAEVGVMLAYTPLHYLILRDNFTALVMTSGNRQDEPTIKDEKVALSDLKDIADYFLSHNRPIVVHNDDSVLRVMGDTPVLIRRARGWVPQPLTLPVSSSKEVLALGAEEKNTITLTRGREAFISQHLGDMRNLRTYQAFEEVLAHLKNILQTEPDVVVCDMHPDYFTTKFAKKFSLPVLPVQHHHAHILSCLAEHQTTEPIIGVCFDGIGYGEDGTIWGCEFLYVDGCRYERFGHLSEIALPGGEAAIKQPWRTALSLLFELFGSRLEDFDIPLFSLVPQEKVERVVQLLQQKRSRAPRASSTGRFFDAVSALCSVCYENTYEGQAPAELEALLYQSTDTVPDAKKKVEHYHYRITHRNDLFVLETEDIVVSVISDITAGESTEKVSLRFHETLCRATVDMCRFGVERYGTKKVALSGGSFQNRYLYLRIKSLLEAQGLSVLTHSEVPPNDAGISLGQALFGKLARK